MSFILFEHKVHSPRENKVIHGKPLLLGRWFVLLACPGLRLRLWHYYKVTTPPVSRKTLRGNLGVEKRSPEQLNRIFGFGFHEFKYRMIRILNIFNYLFIEVNLKYFSQFQVQLNMENCSNVDV